MPGPLTTFAEQESAIVRRGDRVEHTPRRRIVAEKQPGPEPS